MQFRQLKYLLFFLLLAGNIFSVSVMLQQSEQIQELSSKNIILESEKKYLSEKAVLFNNLDKLADRIEILKNQPPIEKTIEKIYIRHEKNIDSVLVLSDSSRAAYIAKYFDAFARKRRD